MADSISLVDIINAAGALIGAEPITSLNDDSKLARQGKALFKFARNESHELNIDWEFATGRAEISAHGVDPIQGSYDYQFELPADCRRVRKLHASTSDSVEYPFKREHLDGKRMILANTSTAYIIYTALITDPNLWPAFFARLVYTRLALMLCGPLKQDKRKVAQLQLEYNAALVSAEASNTESVATNDNDTNEDYGNDDVVDAVIDDTVTKTYIQVKTTDT